jgi:hypothetical protein
MNTKTFEISMNTNCLSSSPALCSDSIIEKLKPLGLKLIADHAKDTVNGFVSIVHDSSHLVRIEIYTENEKPNIHHQSTLEKPITIPSENQIKSLILD